MNIIYILPEKITSIDIIIVETLFTLDNILSLVTLTGLEIVLGIDNIIFIALVIENLPYAKRRKARFIGISLALSMRVVMLFFASWMIGLTEPLFYVYGFGVSGRSLLLGFGGLFLVIKCCYELFETFDEYDLKHINEKEKEPIKKARKAFRTVIIEIVFVDLVFSFDSIIVAVAMTDNLPIIITAVCIAMMVMLLSMKPIGEFISENPGVKVIAIAFIILIGVFLILGAFGYDVPKAYLYFAMFFALVTELINIRLTKKKKLFEDKGGVIKHNIE